jgi:hypothetical protein
MRAGVIVVTGSRSEALARLEVFVGEWVMEARFPGQQRRRLGARLRPHLPPGRLSLLFNLCCPGWLVLPLLSGVSL